MRIEPHAADVVDVEPFESEAGWILRVTLAERCRGRIQDRVRSGATDRSATWNSAFSIPLRRALARLPEQQAEAFCLHALSGWSYDEIGRQTGRSVQLTSTVDPDVLGGVVLRVGNSILDASIRTRLERLRKQVAGA